MTTPYTALHVDLGVASLRSDWRSNFRDDALADASDEAQRIYGKLDGISDVAELEKAIANAAERGHLPTPPAGATVSWRVAAYLQPHEAPCTDYAAIARAFRAQVDREGLGASEIAQFPHIRDRDGRLIAHVSYNGRCWPGSPSQWQSGHSCPLAEFTAPRHEQDPGQVDRLANEIRRIDGNHALGAAALAEALLPFLRNEFVAKPVMDAVASADTRQDDVQPADDEDAARPRP